MASVVFRVNCQATRPGEAVFVVGSGEPLGNWNPVQAVKMSTSSDMFPVWSTPQLAMPTGRAIEYKFIVQREDKKGVQVRWESFNPNRSLDVPEPGTVLTATSAWDDLKSALMSGPQVLGAAPPSPAAPSAPWAAPPDVPAKAREVLSELTVEEALARHEKEEILLKMAEYGIDAAHSETLSACPLAVTIANREERRRNFSQSLFCAESLTPDSQSDAVQPCETPKDAASEAATTDVATELPAASSDVGCFSGTAASHSAASGAFSMANPATGSGSPQTEEEPEELDEDMHADLNSVSLKHIMSFSALTEMAHAEEKEQARKGLKAQSSYEPYNLNVPVVIVSSEIAPWSKTGGLGLVAASYGYEFARKGHRTMAVSPKYKHYDNINYIGEARVRVANGDQNVKYWHRFLDGCDYVFVEHSTFNRDGGLYNDNDGREYHDNLLRFTLLSLAAMEAPLMLNIGGSTYGDKVLFLANDWQAGLVPVYLNYKYRRHNCYTQSRAIYVIHNLGYQGQYHNVDVQQFFGVEHQAAADLKLHNSVNLCKGALMNADRVITVSPNYAQEIQTPGGGFNLQDFVRAKNQANRLAGILNGIDDCWNPDVDSNIFHNYSVGDHVSGKRSNKLALQRLLHLREDPDVCVIGFVGRLTWQKGIDVLGQCIPWLMDDTGNGVTGRTQLIMMGNGDKGHGDMLRHVENTFKGRVCGYVGFDPKVEHQMMAGCDIFLMPSRYEPCGLPQMICQQYGTLPVVTATGGLVDSVIDISEGVATATGFHMPHLAADKMKETLWKAMELFHKRPAEFRQLQVNAMQTDFYWPKAMDEYEKQIDIALYEGPCHR